MVILDVLAGPSPGTCQDIQEHHVQFTRPPGWWTHLTIQLTGAGGAAPSCFLAGQEWQSSGGRVNLFTPQIAARGFWVWVKLKTPQKGSNQLWPNQWLTPQLLLIHTFPEGLTASLFSCQHEDLFFLFFICHLHLLLHLRLMMTTMAFYFGH